MDDPPVAPLGLGEVGLSMCYTPIAPLGLDWFISLLVRQHSDSRYDALCRSLHQGYGIRSMPTTSNLCYLIGNSIYSSVV